MSKVDKSEPPFRWEAEMQTGVEVIDVQHQHLLNMFNDSYASLSSAGSAKAFQRIAKELLNYTIYHFQTEESLMSESGYAEERPEEVERHIREHSEFIEKITAMRESFSADTEDRMLPLLTFLQSWLQTHTREMDMKLGQFIQQKG